MADVRTKIAVETKDTYYSQSQIKKEIEASLCDCEETSISASGVSIPQSSIFWWSSRL